MPSQNYSIDGLFYRQLGEISGSVALVLMADFNFTDTNWDYHTAVTNKSEKFLKCVEDNFLSQLLSKPIRKVAVLDLIFLDTEGLMGDVTVGGYLGHSDHKIVQFEDFSAMRKKKFSKAVTLDFKRAHFKLLRDLVSSVSWESTFEGLGVHEY